MSFKIPNFITYLEFISEANYGVLENDNRIEVVSNNLLNSMIQTLKHTTVENKIIKGVASIPLYTKYKYQTKKDLKVQWILSIEDFIVKPKNIVQGARTDFDRTTGNVILFFDFVKYESMADKEFRRLLLSYLNNDVYVELFHEVKHILDDFDQIFTFKNDSSYINYNGIDDLAKYTSQDQEIHNFIVTVIKQMCNIKDKHPEYNFNQTIQESRMYRQVTLALKNDKRLNKFKTKIAYFWYKTYELGKVN